MKTKSPKSLLKELAEKALANNVLLSSGRPKPGEIIKKLPSEKRKLLSKLKSKDVKNMGFPNYNK